MTVSAPAPAQPVANQKLRYEITKADLPVSCPMQGMDISHSHPRVFLPVEKTGRAKCPYCSAEYVLIPDLKS